jgi:hypothetical protein
MNNTLEISRELAEQILPCLEGRLFACLEKREQIDFEINGLQTSIAELRAKLSNAELPLNGNGEYRKRKPKGLADKVIVDLLSSLPEGLSMAEIRHKTGINHATIHRLLNKPERNKGRFVNVAGKWSLKR